MLYINNLMIMIYVHFGVKQFIHEYGGRDGGVLQRQSQIDIDQLVMTGRQLRPCKWCCAFVPIRNIMNIQKVVIITELASYTAKIALYVYVAINNKDATRRI